MRHISWTKEVELFIRTFEGYLDSPSNSFLEEVAGNLHDLLFYGPSNDFKNLQDASPEYVGPDTEREGYSIYLTFPR